MSKLVQMKRITLEQAREIGGAWMDSNLCVYGSLQEALNHSDPGDVLISAHLDPKPDVSDLTRELYDQINSAAECPDYELGWLCYMDGQNASSTALDVAREVNPDWSKRFDDALSAVALLLLERHGDEGQPWWEGDEYLIVPED